MALEELMGMLFEVREMGPPPGQAAEEEFGPEAPGVPAEGSMSVRYEMCVEDEEYERV